MLALKVAEKSLMMNTIRVCLLLVPRGVMVLARAEMVRLHGPTQMVSLAHAGAAGALPLASALMALRCGQRIRSASGARSTPTARCVSRVCTGCTHVSLRLDSRET